MGLIIFNYMLRYLWLMLLSALLLSVYFLFKRFCKKLKKKFPYRTFDEFMSASEDKFEYHLDDD